MLIHLGVRCYDTAFSTLTLSFIYTQRKEMWKNVDNWQIYVKGIYVHVCLYSLNIQVFWKFEKFQNKKLRKMLKIKKEVNRIFLNLTCLSRATMSLQHLGANWPSGLVPTVSHGSPKAVQTSLQRGYGLKAWVRLLAWKTEV